MASSYAAHSEMFRTEKGRMKGTERVQCDKPLDGCRGKDPITGESSLQFQLLLDQCLV